MPAARAGRRGLKAVQDVFAVCLPDFRALLGLSAITSPIILWNMGDTFETCKTIYVRESKDYMNTSELVGSPIGRLPLRHIQILNPFKGPDWGLFLFVSKGVGRAIRPSETGRLTHDLPRN